MALSLGVLSSARSGNLAAGFTSIATVTAAGGETSLTFSSIPATFTDLQVRGLSREVTNNTGANTNIQFNGDTGTNYTNHLLKAGNTSIAATAAATLAKISIANQTADGGFAANIFAVNITDISDYTSASKNKTVRSIWGTDNNATTPSDIGVSSGLWVSTAAITSIVIKALGAGGFAAGSTFALYGIKAAG